MIEIDYFICFREKEDDLEQKYQLLIRELRSIISIEGTYSLK